MSSKTPMMQQYHKIKAQHQDAILFFRLGDFYEMFEKDAKEASAILGLTLTKRGEVPMCGIPYHSSTNYIRRLLQAGKKVAICEQTTPSEQGKIVDRQVVEIISPGTVLDEAYIESQEGNFIFCLSPGGDDHWYLGALEASTGGLTLFLSEKNQSLETIKKQLVQKKVKEVLIPETLDPQHPLYLLLSEQEGLYIQVYPPWQLHQKRCEELLLEHFQLKSLSVFGLKEGDFEVLPLGILLDYFKSHIPGGLRHIQNITVQDETKGLSMDSSTLKNYSLENT